MLIERLRVINNDKIDTPNGPVVAPVTYSMDVAINEDETIAVPIDQTTYNSLHEAMTAHEGLVNDRNILTME